MHLPKRRVAAPQGSFADRCAKIITARYSKHIAVTACRQRSGPGLVARHHTTKAFHETLRCRAGTFRRDALRCRVRHTSARRPRGTPRALCNEHGVFVALLLFPNRALFAASGEREAELRTRRTRNDITRSYGLLLLRGDLDFTRLHRAPPGDAHHRTRRRRLRLSCGAR
jgi:hypothetical protein